MSKRKQIAQGLSDYRLKIRARKQKALEAKWKQEAAAQQLQAQSAALEAKVARVEAGEQSARTPNPAFDPARWKQQDYAESVRWEQQQAYQSYRQGERAEAQPVAQTQKPWWQKAGEWLQQKVVQPVQDFLTRWSEPPNPSGPLFPKLQTATTALRLTT